jgi:hypothetical protein
VSDRVRPPAFLTNRQGIQSIDELVRTIDSIPKLGHSEFGKGVRASLQSMRAKLAEGNFFSLAMQGAIENWGKGIAKWIPSPDTVQ